jgi:hypothetical protein
MFIIGADPHRGSHVAVVLDDHEQIKDQLTVTANRVKVSLDGGVVAAAPSPPSVGSGVWNIARQDTLVSNIPTSSDPSGRRYTSTTPVCPFKDAIT